MKLAAFDLSLVSTGWATNIGYSQTSFGTITTDVKKISGMARLAYIRNKVLTIANHADVVVFEDLAFAAHDRNHERAGLATLIRFGLWKMNIPYILVAPTTLKKFVMGKGKGEKSQMLLAVYKQWKLDVTNDNEADAVGLLRIGLMVTDQVAAKSKAQREVCALLTKKNSEVLEVLCGLSK